MQVYELPQTSPRSPCPTTPRGPGHPANRLHASNPHSPTNGPESSSGPDHPSQHVLPTNRTTADSSDGCRPQPVLQRMLQIPEVNRRPVTSMSLGRSSDWSVRPVR